MEALTPQLETIKKECFKHLTDYSIKSINIEFDYTKGDYDVDGEYNIFYESKGGLFNRSTEKHVRSIPRYSMKVHITLLKMGQPYGILFFLKPDEYLGKVQEYTTANTLRHSRDLDYEHIITSVIHAVKTEQKLERPTLLHRDLTLQTI